jgi:hypothetical protein
MSVLVLLSAELYFIALMNYFMELWGVKYGHAFLLPTFCVVDSMLKIILYLFVIKDTISIRLFRQTDKFIMHVLNRLSFAHTCEFCTDTCENYQNLALAPQIELIMGFVILGEQFGLKRSKFLLPNP